MNLKFNLPIILILAGILSACSTVTHVNFSSGLKARLAEIPKDSAVVIIDPQGKSVLADTNGKLATPCTLPEHVLKGDRQVAVISKSTCTGLQKGYFVEQIVSETVIKSFPNPHGCLFCITRKTAGGAEQVCKQDGCETQGQH